MGHGGCSRSEGGGRAALLLLRQQKAVRQAEGSGWEGTTRMEVREVLGTPEAKARTERGNCLPKDRLDHEFDAPIVKCAGKALSVGVVGGSGRPYT